MSDGSFDLGDIKKRMTGAVSKLKEEYGGLHTGRASASMLDPITVNSYGAQMPLNQVANVNVPEARMLSVQVWDKSLVEAVEKAIRDSNLGLNPMTEGTTLRIPLPELNEERRREISKVAGQYAEAAKIAVRNVRRDGMDQLKAAEKASDIGKDEHHKSGEDVQAATDSFIKEIEDLFDAKEKDIMTV